MAITKATASSIAPAAKGDLVVGSATNDAAILAVGTNGYTLVADSAEATGLKWAAPAGGGGLTFIKKQTIGSGVSSQQVTNAFSATYDNYLITVTGGVGSASNNDISIRIGAATSGYAYSGFYQSTTSATINAYATDSTSSIGVGTMSAEGAAIQIFVTSPYLTKRTGVAGRGTPLLSGDYRADYAGRLDTTTSYTDFTILTSNTMTGGEIRVYGYQNS